MSRTLSYTVTRTRVWLPALFGLGLIIGKVSLFWGLGFVALAALQASRLLSNTQLDDLLRLREDKRRHKIGRLLTRTERREILALDHYAQKLRASGGDPGLAQDTLDKAWEIVRDHGARDATQELRAFRHSLPPLAGDGQSSRDPDLNQKIQRELDILRATQKEMEGYDLPEPEIITERSTA
jgi:hypothetical protein